MILFANDTTIFNSHMCNKYLQFMLEYDLSLMTDWFNANKLSLNLYKTVAMQFWNNNTNLELRVDNVKILVVETTKFLGVQIDNHLTWHNHVNHLINKLSINKRMMSLGRNLLDWNSLHKVYFAHIHSHLNYSLLVWGSMSSNSLLKELSKLQSQCVEMIVRTRLTDIFNAMQQLNILPVNRMIQLNLRKLGHQMTHKLLPQPLQNIRNADGGKKPHRYPTRNKQTPNIQKHQSIIFNWSFLCQGTKEFIKLNDTLKQEKNPNRFVKLLKKQFNSS